MNKLPFISGSHAYGVPNQDSDIDLVILVNGNCAQFLIDNRDDKNSVRYGRLNLIVLTSEMYYFAWKNATDECMSQKPISREEAIRIFNKHGITDYPDDEETAPIADDAQ